MTDQLRVLKSGLAAQGSPGADVLAPGIPESEVRAALEPLGMDPPGELIEWFGWRNGRRPEVGPSTRDSALVTWYPYSLAEAIASWDEHPRGTELWEWRPGWLPLGDYSGGARLAVNCTPPQGDIATVRYASPFAGWFDESQFPSVTGFATMIGWWNEALDHGWIRYDEVKGAWDPSRLREIPTDQFRTGLMS